MELLVIIGAVVIIGYYAFKRYTKDVEVDESIVAPYKMEAPTLEAEPVQEPVDTTKNWPFPHTPPDAEVPVAAITAKPKAAPKAKAPAKPKAVKAVPAKKAPATKKAPAKKATAAKPKK